MIDLVVADTASAGGEAAATTVEQAIRSNPRLTLGLATGSSPLTTWRALAGRKVDFSRVRCFALDEYIGLPPDHPQRYSAVLRREVGDPLGIDPGAVHLPYESGDPQLAAANFEDALARAGGVDLQVLGIGSNGHIAFNEPGAALDTVTRVVDLHPSTRRDNSRFFDSLDDVPQRAVTQGVATILGARHLLLLAFGQQKADIIAQALTGPVTPHIPASALQLHDHVTVVLDAAAASALPAAILGS